MRRPARVGRDSDVSAVRAEGRPGAILGLRAERARAGLGELGLEAVTETQGDRGARLAWR